MGKILVIYYTQTGQLKQIVDSITEPLQEGNQLIFRELKPVPPYPFPWNGMPFFQVFPESVKEISCQLEPFGFDPDADYDLVILAYQVWFLSPSIPVTSFLQSETAQRLLKGKPVITVLGIRNMWIMAHERVKAMIADAGGSLAGNIVLADPSSNLRSVVTIVRWMMKGKKEPFRRLGISFKAAGVPYPEIKNAGRFGDIIAKALKEDSLHGVQTDLIEAGSVKVDPVLFNIEKRGKMMFGIWAKLILKKGPYNDPGREKKLRLFKVYLFMVIYLLSPVVAGIFRLGYIFNPGAAKRTIQKYS